MTATLVERLGALGDLGFTHRWDPYIYGLLAEGALVRFRWGESDAQLKTLVVTRRGGDPRTGITIGGRDPRVLLGVDNRGPVVAEREYVAGTTHLSNGGFVLLDPAIPTHALFWSFVEGTSWAADGTGLVALTSIVPTEDDVLIADEQPPAKAGQTWEARVDAPWLDPSLAPAGLFRLRLTYFGKYRNATLLASDGDLGGGDVGWTLGPTYTFDVAAARTKLGGLRAGVIPKPQLVVNSTFVGGTGWSRPDATDITDPLTGDISILNDPSLAYPGDNWVMVFEPNPWPQLLTNGGFEGGGWTDVSPVAGDTEITSVAARTGSWGLEMKPVTQKQLILNPDMESNSYWYQNTDLADPSGVYFYDPGQGMEGTRALTTSGVAGGAEYKYLRAQFDGSTGVTPATVAEGEEYEIESWIDASATASAIATIYGHIPHPTLANHERFYNSPDQDLTRLASATVQYHRLSVRVAIPANRTQLNVGMTLSHHHVGDIRWDNTTCTRVRGNRSKMQATTVIPVTSRVSYKLVAHAKATDTNTGGNVKVGGVLSGTVADQPIGVDQGQTDFVWQRVEHDFSPSDGQTGFRPTFDGLDITGGSIYIDDVSLYKTSDNSAEVTGTPFDVVGDQRYLLVVPVWSETTVTRGKVTFGLRLSGPGLVDEVVSYDQAATKGEWLVGGGGNTEVRTKPGYVLATPFARSTDIEGGLFALRRFDLIKMDNNTDETVGPTLALTPQRQFRALASVRGGVDLQRGDVRFVATFTDPLRATEVAPSSPIGDTKGAWQTLSFDFSPPSGYDNTTLKVLSTDIEGAPIDIADLTIIDLDTGTRVVDAVGSTNGTLVASGVAPDGTEKVAISLIAEAGARAWEASSALLHRIDEPIPTAAAVVDDLLKDPVTGVYRLLPGDIYGDDPILHDWTIRQQSLRTLLVHLSTSGLVYPLREDRVSADLRYHWGTAEQLYVERDALVLTGSRAIVRSGVGVERNSEQRVDRVVVIGATKTDAVGRSVQVLGSAENAPAQPGRVDTLVVEDSSAETVAYAESLARYHLDRAATAVVNVTATLDAWQSIDNFDVGDWVFPENREAQLEDMARVVDVAGETVFPVRERVVGRTLRMGRDFSAEVYDESSGEWVPLSGVAWEKATSCDVELGTPLPNFLADPQNGAAVVQFNAFRLATARR